MVTDRVGALLATGGPERDSMNLYRLADHTNPESYASLRRRARMKWFLPLLEASPEPVRILDIGGTAKFLEEQRP